MNPSTRLHNSHHTGTGARTDNAPQQGLPLDTLSPDQLGLIVQRQTRAMRRGQNDITTHLALGQQTASMASPVLRVPLATTLPEAVPHTVAGTPIRPPERHQNFIDEHIAPRLPEADYPPPPPVDKRVQPTRPGISYLFAQSKAAGASPGASQSFSRAPTSVVYGPGVSYLSLDVRTWCDGSFATSTAITDCTMQSPPQSRSATPDPPMDLGLTARGGGVKTTSLEPEHTTDIPPFRDPAALMSITKTSAAAAAAPASACAGHTDTHPIVRILPHDAVNWWTFPPGDNDADNMSLAAESSTCSVQVSPPLACQAHDGNECCHHKFLSSAHASCSTASSDGHRACPTLPVHFADEPVVNLSETRRYRAARHLPPPLASASSMTGMDSFTSFQSKSQVVAHLCAAESKEDIDLV